MKRQHPIKIISYISRNIWMLLIPLVRGLMALQWDLFSWVKGAWLDILVLLLLFGSAVWRWSRSYFGIENGCVVYKNGVLWQESFSIPIDRFCAVTGERKLLYKPFNAVVLHLDTFSGNIAAPDLTLIMRRKDYREVFGEFYEKKYNRRSSPKALYYPRKSHLVLFSFVFSSTLSGILYVAAFIYQAGDVSAEFIEKHFMTAVTDVTSKLALGIPPVATALAAILLGGWLISFISNLIRHIGFHLDRKEDIITIKTGFFTNRHYLMDIKKIVYADIRQNLLMKIFRIMSVQVNCPGYGKQKNEIPVLIPITTKEQVLSTLNLILPGFRVMKSELKPRFSGFFRHLMTPMTIGIWAAVAYFAVIWLLPMYKILADYLLITIEIPMIWMLIVKIIGFFDTGIADDGDNLCVRYHFGYALHTILLPKSRISKITVTQTIFQVITNCAHIRIFTNGEASVWHTVLAVDLDDTEDFLRKAGIPAEKVTYFTKRFSTRKKAAEKK